VIRDGKPWFLVEVQKGETSLSPTLRAFQKQIKAPFAFQVVIDMDYVDAIQRWYESLHVTPATE
jgi:hypothetical protein